ncbi:MAG: hypothetical protein DHS20C10_12510 [marine bacterium B5-7]|nr:MAG: hypothetical protein DHS20C10_12510 [marine bacterium B5-7]
MLLQSHFREEALNANAILKDVIYTKKAFYHANYARYDDCLEKKIHLIPTGDFLKALKTDYKKMLQADMFILKPPSFEEILETLREAQKVMNS